jgi:hypothetical protein
MGRISRIGPILHFGGRQLKTFEFGGGSLTLAIPADWTQEDEEDGVGVFYSDAADAGVLRIRPRAYHNPTQYVTPEALSALLTGMAERLAPDQKLAIETLENSAMLLTYLQTFPDDNPPLVVASWLVGIAVSPHTVQMFSYTYTVPGQFAATKATIEELELVEEAIRGAVVDGP